MMIRITRAKLNKKYNISPNDWTRKHDLIMEHLSNYMEITELKENGQYIYVIEDDLPETIPPIPRKSKKTEAQKDYDEFIQQYFSESVPRYASKAKVARDAMEAFSTQKYGHNNAQSVIRRYITAAFEKYVEEVPNSECWVWSKTYEPLSDNELQHWAKKQQAEAFREFCAGNDISEACAAYKQATSDRAIKVSQYLLKKLS